METPKHYTQARALEIMSDCRLFPLVQMILGTCEIEAREIVRHSPGIAAQQIQSYLAQEG